MRPGISPSKKDIAPIDHNANISVVNNNQIKSNYNHPAKL